MLIIHLEAWINTGWQWVGNQANVVRRDCTWKCSFQHKEEEEGSKRTHEQGWCWRQGPHRCVSHDASPDDPLDATHATYKAPPLSALDRKCPCWWASSCSRSHPYPYPCIRRRPCHLPLLGALPCAFLHANLHLRVHFSGNPTEVMTWKNLETFLNCVIFLISSQKKKARTKKRKENKKNSITSS